MHEGFDDHACLTVVETPEDVLLFVIGYGFDKHGEKNPNWGT